MSETKYDLLTIPYREELLKNLKEFIAIDSVYDENTVSEENPFGIGVTNALKFIEELAKKDGFIVNNYSNKVIEILTNEKEENITIMAHADVVPEGEGWSNNPFKLVEKDGVLYGRGVADDKGPLLSSYYAMKALRDNHLLGDYQVRFLVGGNEERGSLCMHHYFHELNKKSPTVGFSPDAEYPLVYAEKGIINYFIEGDITLPNIYSINGGLAINSVIEKCFINMKHDSAFIAYLSNSKLPYEIEENDDHDKITIIGVSAHGAMPELGKNAGIEALRLIGEYYNHEVIKSLVNKYSDVYGKGINCYTYSENMECSTSMNVGIVSFIDNKLKIGVNLRYVDNANPKQLKLNFIKASKPLVLTNVNEGELLFYDKSSTLVETLLETYQKETNDYTSKPLAIGGGTYAKEAKNVVAFGSEFPGWNSDMHAPDEKMRKEDLFKNISIYARAILELGKKIHEN